MSGSKFQPHFVRLCDQLNVGKLLPYLVQERMLTGDEYETVTNITFTRRQQREKLLLIIPRKGRNYFENFGKCLVWSGQKELAQHIGVDIDKVPPPPFQAEETQIQCVNDSLRDQELLQAIKNLIGPPNPGSRLEPVGMISNPPSYSLPSHISTHHQPVSQHQHHYSAEGYPPSAERKSVTGLPPVMQQPVENRPQGPTNVFILYCKDTELASAHGVTVDKFCGVILKLADILTKCGGIICSMDMYEKEPQQNWNIWTLNKIEESKYVVMICSPMLKNYLSTGIRSDVNMFQGRFFSDAVVNSITSPKFIPVFLNEYKHLSPKSWIPLQLLMSRIFHLENVGKFYDDVGMSTQPDSSILNRQLSQALGQPAYRELAEFVQYLRGNQAVAPPERPAEPIFIQPYGGSHSVSAGQHLEYSRSSNQAENIPESDFIKIAERLPRDWVHLGIKIGIEYNTIEYLKRKHPLNQQLAALEMFGIWKSSKGKAATKRALKKALLDLNFGRLANELYPNEKI